MNPERNTQQKLDEDLAVQGTPQDGELAIPADGDNKSDEEDAMEEVQEEAAEERKEGGYQ